MNLDEIENGIKTALTERIKVRTCYLSSATGNIFEYGNKKYIITCKHVADYFFSQSNQRVLLRTNQKIPQNKLKYVASTDDSIDIAIIEILEADEIKYCYSKDDFDIIDNFSDADLDNSNFFVLGYPEQLKYEKDNADYILWMSYLTIKNEQNQSTDQFLYLDYPRFSEKNIINEKGIKTILPNARGLSGAFIFRIDTFDGKLNKLWLPTMAKIVAVQSAWNKKDWLKGSNTKYLFELLKKVSAT